MTPPRIRIPPESTTPRPKIGLVLGSGSARGLAHIGVIRAIEEMGIKVDVVAGTSMGALIGAVYASGRLDALEHAFRNFDWRSIGSLFDPVFPRSGLINGKKIAEFLRTHVPLQSIGELPVPFCAVATDISNGEEVVIREGNLVEAVRASISVPGIFTPVRRDSRILVDGGLVNPVPVDAARALGADLVVAIDLNHEIVAGKAHRRKARAGQKRSAALARLGVRNYVWAASRMGKGLQTTEHPAVVRVRAWLDKDPLPSMTEVLLASMHIMQVRLTESRLDIEQPEILIRPPLGSVHLLEFDRAEEVIAIGYKSALGPIRALAKSLGQARE